jgi:hypothetical protein
LQPDPGAPAKPLELRVLKRVCGNKKLLKLILNPPRDVPDILNNPAFDDETTNCSVSARCNWNGSPKRCPLIERFRPGASRWKLKNRRLLTFSQKRQEPDLPVRKLERIMMVTRLVVVDLPEYCRPVAGVAFAPRPRTQAPHVI